MQSVGLDIGEQGIYSNPTGIKAIAQVNLTIE